METMTKCQAPPLAFPSLTEQLDPATATGQLVFPLVGALAAWARKLIRERPLAGLAARASG